MSSSFSQVCGHWLPLSELHFTDEKMHCSLQGHSRRRTLTQRSLTLTHQLPPNAGGPSLGALGAQAWMCRARKHFVHKMTLSESLLLFLAQSRGASPSGVSRGRDAVGSGPGGQRSPSQQLLSRSGCLTPDRHNVLLPSCKASACVSSMS
ncbi:hypothetical protein mRhiFer1_009204 [Rhinolophus ferrumequinum]|uniref:Uncharacterized protein n=1 Tax=Rhinolophus ferrumequinum TaxID=59479 RepID=A0A7J7SJH5_RHIFE|nr:hypothetical protein mRhiFer1_009204 [Rhinolophus ferrumequinum]